MKKLACFATTLAMAGTLALPAVTLAQAAPTADTVGITAVQNSGMQLSGGDVRQTVANIINVALGFLAIIAVIIVLVGGFKYMLSGGSEDKTSEARKLIVSGIIGLAIILSAWAITSFVLSRLLAATAQ
ncbi:MAG: pilin [Patescibacteria group bacterium]